MGIADMLRVDEIPGKGVYLHTSPGGPLLQFLLPHPLLMGQQHVDPGILAPDLEPSLKGPKLPQQTIMCPT